MRKTSTLIYLVNNFECTQNLLINTADLAVDDLVDFDDVLKLLDKVNAEPSAESIRKIVDFARNYR